MHKRIVGAVALAAFLVTAPALAATPAGGDVDALERRVEELERELERLSEEIPPTTGTQTSVEPASRAELEVLRDEVDRLLDELPDVSLSGELDLSYGYNFNRPEDGENRLRAFDIEDEGFRFDLARLSVATRVLEHAEARIDVLFGETARRLGEATRGAVGSDDVDVEQAFVSYRVGVGEGLDLTFGKFATPLGAEVIAAPDNDHFSRSLLFTYATPFTHTGLLARSSFLDGQAEVALGLVNGWDAVSDGNDGKTVLARVATRLGPRASLAVAGTWGAEQEGRSGPKRGVVDVVTTLRPLDAFSLLLTFNYGAEEEVPLGPDGTELRDAEWLGFGGSLRWDATSWFGVAVRGERFHDVDGARTGTAQDLWEVTGTVSVEVVSNLVARLEYRHDASDEASFDDRGAPARTQDTISVDLSYRF